MKNDQNPFTIKGYTGPELFCDRVSETGKLVRNMKNSANTLLISNRRMGKTGLILHTFYQLNKQDQIPCLYVDIFATKNLADFTNQLASAMLDAFPEKNSLGRKALKWLKSLSPVISYDSLTGIPQVSLAYTQPEQTENSLSGIFRFLEQMNTPIVIAFDEFQQILQYPEKNTEALLRTHIQHLHNLHFIFSGSSKHMLTNIFADSRRPFFASTSIISLTEIDKKEYSKFIEINFKKYKRRITDEAINYLLDWSMQHTYYTQYVCNHIFAENSKEIAIENVRKTCIEILLEQEPIFYQYRQMLTPIQWNILNGIAREHKVYQPNSKVFLQKYKLGTPANMKRAIDSLTRNEMLLNDRDEKGNFYRVYNVFLLRWLEYKS